MTTTTFALAVAVIGSRSFDNYILLEETLDQYQIKKIVSGGARGADKLAETYAKENNIEMQISYPDWELHGKATGPIRNRDIVDAVDIVISFWDGKSKGTLSSIEYARKVGKQVVIINFIP